jgi:hypothetical protein
VDGGCGLKGGLWVGIRGRIELLGDGDGTKRLD